MHYPIALLKSQPSPNMAYRVLTRHPWFYADEIQNLRELGINHPPGSIVSVQTADGKCLGYGTFNRAPRIAIRLIGSKLEIQNLIEGALKLRRPEDGQLINGDGDCLPGLFVEKKSENIVTAKATTFGAMQWLSTAKAVLESRNFQVITDKQPFRKERSNEEFEMKNLEIAKKFVCMQKVSNSLEVGTSPDFSTRLKKQFPGAQVTFVSTTRIEDSSILQVATSEPLQELQSMAEAGLSFPLVICRPPQPARDFRLTFKKISPWAAASLRLVSKGGRLVLTCAVAGDRTHDAVDFVMRASKEARRRVVIEMKIRGVSEDAPSLTVLNDENVLVTVVCRVLN